jgi:outer membrane protein assembly factor BamE (lipoprotein component of BamABCDE complex)
MKKIVLFFIGFILIIVVFSYSFSGFNSNKNIGINTSKIRAVKVGMSVGKVISILGKPIQIKDRYESKGKTFTYTKVPKYAMEYPMLWVHFDNKKKVEAVFAKRYILWGMDDECIYALDSNSDTKKY